MPKVVWLGLATRSRLDWLVRAQSEDLACSSAACAIELGLLENFLIPVKYWQQHSALRRDLEDLRRENLDLAQELERIGRQLEQGSFSSLISIVGEHGARSGWPSSEEIGRDRCRLAERWEETVERVRLLPQFENLLRPTPFHDLRNAAKSRQIILINVNEYRVDALVVDAKRIFGTYEYAISI